MNRALERFNLVIKDTRHLSDIYKYFNVPDALDDLLRWQWTQALSALDKYLHDIIKVGMIKTFNNEIPPTKSYVNYSVPISVFQSSLEPVQAFEQYIVKNLSFQSYQAPDKINEGLSLIWSEEHKWQKIASSMLEDQKDIKSSLKLIVQRRNQMVHQSDYSSTNLERDTIRIEQSIWVVDYIERLVYVIHNEIENYLTNNSLETVDNLQI